MGPPPQRKKPRRAAYALPTLFTSGNIFLGFLSLMNAFEGARTGDANHYATAAKALGFAVFFDGLDGFVARMTNTTSDFGRELDSLADVITFGIAPAVLAYVWGVLGVQSDSALRGHLTSAGYFVAFFYLLCGAVRLARFNVQTNPMPRNPGRPDRKYFVGMAIPAGAGLIAAVVFMDPEPVRSFSFSVAWLILLIVAGLLMVSTWRYPSFKQLGFSKARSPLFVLIVGGAAMLIANWPQPVLLAMACAYVASGIIIRIGGIVRRYRRARGEAHIPERQIG
jgi:CDP-diacylglycerol--serine O-phosphatidyltransferase